MSHATAVHCHRTAKNVGSNVLPDQSSPTAATFYGEYLKDELAGQELRKASFEQRGLAVVTTAGTLVTLLFGLAALSATTATGSPLAAEEKFWLAAALGLFVVSAACALGTNFPLNYEGPETSEILERLEATPEDNPDVAIYVVADLRAKILTDAQRKNTLKGYLLFAALLIEVVAVACVGVAIFEVIHPAL